MTKTKQREEGSACGEIILNRLFAGSFLDDNIGHEIVNLYKDDGGRNLVYVQPYGTYQRVHHGKITHVMMVRAIPGKGAVEVLGLASGLHELYDPSLQPALLWKNHQEFLMAQNVLYGGVSILDIFSRHRSDESITVQPVFATFLADTVKRPRIPVYIVYRNGAAIEGNPSAINIFLCNTNQPRCSLKQYFNNQSEDYHLIEDLINSEDLWTIDTQTLSLSDGDSHKPVDTFWSICSVEDYELAWSSAIAYFMKKYPELVVEFARERLGVITNPFSIVERETDNIDILLENEDTVVVIENKITSKINGIQVRDDKLVGTQLIKYHRKALERVCKPEKPIMSFEDWRECMSKCPKKISCFILTPDYNPIDLSSYDTPHDENDPQSPMFRCEEIYTQIFYSEIYDYLKGRHQEDIYFQDMINAMKQHSTAFHNDLFEITRTKFLRQIERVRTRKCKSLFG